MTVKASGRSALILATGLFVCLAGPSQAMAGTDTAASSKSESAGTERATRHSKSYAHRKSGKPASKSSTDDKAAADDRDGSAAIPAWVANANAQLTTADTTVGNASAMSARANDILQAASDNPAGTQSAVETQVVAADQLNEVDRALQEGQPQVAQADAPAAPTPVVIRSSENSTWDQTSLIGKIFIAFGGLLTVASAARMFMA